MAVLRQVNFLGQQRVDVPHLRALESGVSFDFDLLAGSVLAGGVPLVIKGFDLITASAYNNPATSLQLRVAGGLILHPTASESGTVFAVDTDTAVEVLNGTNPNVVGSFTPNQTNYVGLDLRRTTDNETSDLVMFLDANSLLETPKTVPLARTLSYRIVISTVDFTSTPNILPLAKVQTDDSNRVVNDGITDARPLMFRLGSGGSIPDALNCFPWRDGRDEAKSGVFQGGDKVIGSLKEFGDAVMTRLWELGGGEHWYSPTSERDVKLTFGPDLLSNGDNFLWDLDTETLQWSGLSLVFANSTSTYNTISNGSATLGDGQCLFVDVDRSSNAVLVVQDAVPLSSLGSPLIPGSRQILAWRLGEHVYIRGKEYEVGRAYKYATSASGTSGLGVVRLAYAAQNQTYPTVLPLDPSGQIKNIYATGDTSAFYGVGAGTKFGGEFYGGSGLGNAGVYGRGGSNSGTGGYFVGGDTDGIGVEAYGDGTGTGVKASGGSYGVDASATGATGVGVQGSGKSSGVYGLGTGTDSNGIMGVGTGAGSGVYGTNPDNSGPGVQGASGGAATAVLGTATGSGIAVYGESATGIGVKGQTYGNVAGVRGESQSGNGVHGRGLTAGNGVYGEGVTGAGVRGESQSGYGVHGVGGTSAAGVYGKGGSTRGHGVLGQGTGQDSGVYGYALGNGNGVTGIASSSFGIGGDFSGGFTALRAMGNGTGDGAQIYGGETGGAAIKALGGAQGGADKGGTAAVLTGGGSGTAGGLGAEVKGGNGTATGGVGLEVSGGTGAGGALAKAIVATGDVSTTKDYTYESAKTYRMFLSPFEFRAGYSIQSPAKTFEIQYASIPYIIGKASPDQPLETYVSFRLPAGAVLTGVKVFVKNAHNAVAHTLSFYMEKVRFNSPVDALYPEGWSITTTHNKTFNYVNDMEPYDLPINTPANCTADGDASYFMVLIKDDFNNYMEIYGAMVTYTLSKVAA